jgi:hypothetical protein
VFFIIFSLSHMLTPLRHTLFPSHKICCPSSVILSPSIIFFPFLLISSSQHNNRPKPCSPGSAPFAAAPFDPVVKNSSNNNNNNPTAVSENRPNFSMKSFDEYDTFPRPPPPPVHLTSGQSQDEVPRAKSPVVPNTQVAYAPTLQEQWLAKKQQQAGSPYKQQQQQSVPSMTAPKPFTRSDSYDRKMHDIREAHADILPSNPQTAYAPTLQEQW